MSKTRSKANGPHITQTFQRFFFFLVIIIIGIIALSTTIVVFYMGISDPEFTEKFTPLSEFASGILTPIFAFLSFIAILATLVLQKIEIIASRREFQRSANALEAHNSEPAFFQMLEFHNSIVNSIANKEYTGRDCFEIYYSSLRSIYMTGTYPKKTSATLSEKQQAISSYNEFYDRHQLEIGHYFRFLYNFLKIIDANPKANQNHIKLLRAQLSNQELVIIYYNCISDLGVNFKPLAVKHNLFDNMPEHLLLNPSHVELIPKPS